MTSMRNRAKCARCDTVVESTHRHDFVVCRCGSIFVDGGTDYHRAGFDKLEDFIWLGDNDDIDGDDS
jgi:hypothetical protein